MNKDKIKNLILVMIVAVISGSLSSILTTNTISTNKLLGSVSHSDYLDSSNVTYLDSNVQDSIDNLYTCASNYSKINNKIGSNSLNTTNQTLTGAVNELNNRIGSIKSVVQVDMGTNLNYTISNVSGTYPTFLLYGFGGEPIGYIFAVGALNSDNPSMHSVKFGDSSETITFSVSKGSITLKMPGYWRQFTIISSFSFVGTIS